ncbi:MAG: hypothetical protein QF577_00195 [Phycisphaerae bacterium]|jgi:hypothetical protein|nr:hypothetical protein [Phycisphaerae bacterium]MDP7635945.1 hypothetical protein [Phycisphaerae bacterium]
MAKKMYYSEEEAIAALGISVEELARYVSDSRLRVFKDGDRNMYKAEEVDVLAGGEKAEEVELTPAEDKDADVVSLTEVSEPGEGDVKEDTVITAEGISIFDEEDLEIEAADPLAQTQVAASLEDQISIEGVGSGSGLLDLTRESDDTSLGAELLDNIDLEGRAAHGPVPLQETAAVQEAPYPIQPEVIVEAVDVVEVPDPSASLYSGMLIGGFVIAILIGGVMLAGISGRMPGYLVALDSNLIVLLLVGVVITGVAGALGLMLGKAAAGPRASSKAADDTAATAE